MSFFGRILAADALSSRRSELGILRISAVRSPTAPSVNVCTRVSLASARSNVPSGRTNQVPTVMRSV